jgi:hypothetical protein
MNSEPHPLQSIVFAAFAERAHHDATSLACFLSGGYVRGAQRGYNIVARDVLGYTADQGLLERDDAGWYRRTPESP